MRISSRSRTAPFIAMDVLAEAMGRSETLGYTGGLGLDALRSGIAALYRRRYGIDFDPARGHATVRFSFAQPPEKIAEGIERLAGFIKAGTRSG